MREHPVTVAEAMLTTPVLSSTADTADDVRRLLAGEHRHVALVVDENGTLLTLIGRHDLADVRGDRPASEIGGLDGQTVSPDADLSTTHRSMLAEGRRRLAVVDDEGRLLGLLCLKRHGGGFCTAETVAERGADPR